MAAKGDQLPPVDGDDGMLVYGYLGLRAIVGRVSPDRGRWSATFRFVGSREPFTMAGAAKPRERDGAAEEGASLDQPPRHHDLDCLLDVGGAGVEGSLEATCLREGDRVEVSGYFSPAASSASGAAAEPFFARTPEKSGDEQERYYAALVATSAGRHACAPFVEVIEATPRPSGRSAVLYTMRYPCEETEPEDPSLSTAPRPVTRRAYVADVTEDEPPKAVAAAAWASLGDPDDSHEIRYHLSPVELMPGVELYVATLWDRFQSPNMNADTTRVDNVAWAVAADGRYGKPVDLPDLQSGHAGACHSVSMTRELWLTDLDGDKRPELIARTSSESMGQSGKPGPDGFIPCTPQPREVSTLAFTFDPATLAWSAHELPKRIADKQLAAGRRIAVP